MAAFSMPPPQWGFIPAPGIKMSGQTVEYV